MQMTKLELLQFSKDLETIISKNLTLPFKMSYALIKTKNSIYREVETVQQVFTQSEEFIQTEKKRIELLTKYSDKDENGDPIIENNNYKISSENRVAFQAEYMPIANELNKQNLETVEVQIHYINSNDIPASLELDTQTTAVISKLISE